MLASAIASGTGLILLFFTFSMFALPIMAELKMSRGELSGVQALIITAALGSPLLGRWADLYGFRPIYIISACLVAGFELALALVVDSRPAMMVCIGLLSFFGVGTTAVVTTRPISAHFRKHRGKALGLVAVGVSISAMLFPPLLQAMLTDYGWRGGFVTLACLPLLIGVPLVLLLLPKEAGQALSGIKGSHGASDWSFLRTADFWLMGAAIVVMAIATSGFVGQLSPMIQEEGLSADTAALALSIFAAGQFVGRLGGGWVLDHFNPRWVAVAFTIIPGMGFLVLLLVDGMATAALFAAGMIGLQQGAELDIFAYYTARRFDVARYGTIYGALIGLGWIGNAVGILGIGQLHDHFGNYQMAQALGMAALVLGALLIAPVRLPKA